MAAMKIENTTGRLLEPVYLIDEAHKDAAVVLPIYGLAQQVAGQKKPKPMVGVPPGTHHIDGVSAAILLAHKGNQIFFEGVGDQPPMLKISPGAAKSQEDAERHQPVTIRCRPEAIAAWQKTHSKKS